MTLHIFLLGLLIVSTLTGLVTEAVKNLMAEHNKTYYSNTLAGCISFILSVFVGLCYILVSEIKFTTPIIVYLVVLAFMSWLCSLVGYDKVIQAISQFKTTGKGSDQ